MKPHDDIDRDAIAAWARHAANSSGFGDAGHAEGALALMLRGKSKRAAEREVRFVDPRAGVIDRIIREHLVPLP